MAEASPTMSGANNAVVTAAQETAQSAPAPPATNDQPERRPSSEQPAPSSNLPATSGGGDNDASAAAVAAQEASATQQTAAPAGSIDAAAAANSDAHAHAAAAAAGASASSGGVLEAPRPPEAAVTRGRSDSLAINPSNEIAPVTSAAAGADGGVVCNITLLLPSGNRHPFRIDDRYLTKRGVEVPDLTESGRRDPYSISVYKLKELILREWREDWEGKPASPSSIRLIHFGKLLDDKEQLRKYHFSTDAPNVVHMSVKPPEMMEDEEAAKGKSSSREPRNRDGSTSCCVIL